MRRYGKTEIVEMFSVPARRRNTGWFRFFVPLDGLSVALEVKIEASGQVGGLRVSGQQSEILDATPRLRDALVNGAENSIAMLNLLLDEFDMPWEVLRSFRNRNGIAGAIIEAADNRLLELRASSRDDTNDCA